MKLTEMLLEELTAEAERSRRALEEVPAGKHDWKPHDRSMMFGPLTDMVATIPTWVAMIVNKNELDVAPAGGPTMKREPKQTSAEYLKALDMSVAEGKAALQSTTDEHLMTPWKLLARGQVAVESPRYAMIRDTLNHWAHHRGQMTVYLRLMGCKVPSMYGPTADDQRF